MNADRRKFLDGEAVRAARKRPPSRKRRLVLRAAAVARAAARAVFDAECDLGGQAR